MARGCIKTDAHRDAFDATRSKLATCLRGHAPLSIARIVTKDGGFRLFLNKGETETKAKHAFLKCARNSIALSSFLPGCKIDLSWRSASQQWPKRLSRRVLQQGMARNRFVDCYETFLSTNWSRDGRVVVKFVVSPTGNVKEAQLMANEFNAKMGRCVLDEVRGSHFERLSTDGGGDITVTRPFSFKR